MTNQNNAPSPIQQMITDYKTASDAWIVAINDCEAAERDAPRTAKKSYQPDLPPALDFFYPECHIWNNLCTEYNKGELTECKIILFNKRVSEIAQSGSPEKHEAFCQTLRSMGERGEKRDFEVEMSIDAAKERELKRLKFEEIAKHNDQRLRWYRNHMAEHNKQREDLGLNQLEHKRDAADHKQRELENDILNYTPKNLEEYKIKTEFILKELSAGYDDIENSEYFDGKAMFILSKDTALLSHLS